MARHRVLAIGLDGFDVTVAERYMAEGQMPALAELRKRAARFLLDEGQARRAGLPWEHVASGLSPNEAGRWSPVDFDPSSYTAWQAGTRFTPWWDNTGLRVVVFDPPFVDLRRAPNTQGIVAWGSHSPGSTREARPAALMADFVRQFGEYPADEWKYGTPWPSAARTRLMGERLCHALDVRGRAAQWLATERFPDWDFFFAVAGELHGAAEGLWHGIDAGHPLNNHRSGAAAADALLEIHRALDRMIGKLVNAAGDAVVIAFNMGGMGPNECDVQSMVLLPELLYRNAFGRPLLTLPSAWTANPNRIPILDEHEDWETARQSWVPEPNGTESAGNLRAAASRLPEPIKRVLRGVRSAVVDRRFGQAPAETVIQDVGYIPSYAYRHHWPLMPAFAVPAFLDGRIRINLRGRERDGIVELSRYEETCRTLEMLLFECRDPRTGGPAVEAIERSTTDNPMTLGRSDSDLLVVWSGSATAIEHPRLGLIGPVPYRRTGGHTRHGIAYLAAPGLEPGERGVRSSHDVVPTIVELLGAEPITRLTGKSLLSASVR